MPQGNEKELNEMAQQLGLELLFLYPPNRNPASQPSGILCTHNEVRKGCFLLSSEHDKDALALRPAAIIGLGESEKPDRIHQRTAGIDQPLAKEMASKKCTVIISTASILRQEGKERAILLGRWMQNIFVCRKAGVSVVIASCASTPWELRAAHERQALGMLLGMTEQEAAASTEFFNA